MNSSLSNKSSAVLVGLFGLALLVGVVAIVWWREPGWGGFIWLASFSAICAIRTPYALRSRGNVITESRDDRTDRLLIAGMAVGGFVLPFIYLATPLLDIADYDLPGWATALGAGLQVPMLLLFWRSHADLGRNWSAELQVRSGHELVTRGAYARIRHPMYASLWLWTIAQPLLLHNWIAGILSVPASGALYFVRTPREEAMMRDRFGSAWDAYATRTGRLLPKVRRP
jgi:protein-S-isoprenylcysteine O-methyltransferase Ste14